MPNALSSDFSVSGPVSGTLAQIQCLHAHIFRLLSKSLSIWFHLYLGSMQQIGCVGADL